MVLNSGCDLRKWNDLLKSSIKVLSDATVKSDGRRDAEEAK